MDLPAPAAADTGFEQLPESVLVAILRRVPQRDRLAACARVSTAWATAAAAASADVVVPTDRPAHKVPALQAWLEHHAQHVVSLRVGARHQTNLTLALPTTALVRLRQLEVHGIQPTLTVQGNSSSQPPLLPALRSVKLRSSAVTGWAASMAVLQRPQLTALELCHEYAFHAAAAGTEPAAHQQLQQAVAALLQAQPRLSVLRLERMPLTDAVLAPLSSMQQLQELSIDDDSAGVTPHRVVGLCSHLTSLELSLHQGARLAASPSAQLPPCLASLSLTSVQLEPAVLGSLTQLEQLQLADCPLLPGHTLAHKAHPLDVAAGTATLMSALAQLKRLCSLQLQNTYLGALDEQQLHAFSALTASSQLSRLEVCAYWTQPLPRSTLQHMLPPGRVLGQLMALKLDWEGSTNIRPGSFEADEWCVDAADVASISAACPSLETLELYGVVRAAPEVVSSLGTLQRLPLLQLHLGDSTGWLTHGAAAALARISSLTELRFIIAPLLTDLGLEHLTALRQLRLLDASGWGFSAGFRHMLAQPGNEDGRTLELHTHRKDAAPDVAQQLEAVLENSAAVQQARRMSELEAALVAKAARVAELEAQLASQGRRAAGAAGGVALVG